MKSECLNLKIFYQVTFLLFASQILAVVIIVLLYKLYYFWLAYAISYLWILFFPLKLFVILTLKRHMHTYTPKTFGCEVFLNTCDEHFFKKVNYQLHSLNSFLFYLVFVKINTDFKSHLFLNLRKRYLNLSFPLFLFVLSRSDWTTQKCIFYQDVVVATCSDSFFGCWEFFVHS